MTTDAIYEEHGSHWSQQASAMVTTRWMQCDQTLPSLSAKSVACETKERKVLEEQGVAELSVCQNRAVVNVLPPVPLILSLSLSPSLPTLSLSPLHSFPPPSQITSGEYIQMSGRAGRRGLDERGIVMLMVDERMDSTVGKGLLRVCP